MEQNVEKILNEKELEQVAGGAQKLGRALIFNCQHRCNARKGPGTEYEKWGYAYAGKVYDFYGWTNGWAMLKIDGYYKYVFKDFVMIIDYD